MDSVLGDLMILVREHRGKHMRTPIFAKLFILAPTCETLNAKILSPSRTGAHLRPSHAREGDVGRGGRAIHGKGLG